MEKGEFVVIGGKYAQGRGYTHAVGEVGVVRCRHKTSICVYPYIAGRFQNLVHVHRKDAVVVTNDIVVNDVAARAFLAKEGLL